MVKRFTAIALTAVLSSAGTAAVLVALPAGAQQDPGAEEEATEDAKAEHPRHCAPGRFLAGLIEDGTITEEQADAIREALRAAVRERERGTSRLEVLEGALAGLVAEGTISQQQADAVTALVEERRAALSERRERFQERREHFRERMRERGFKRFHDRGDPDASTFTPRWVPPGDASLAA